MHIKELVLDDFKSFGRKTRIPFYDDFTTVSGPNGSGKSNIIDSVLFALGLARTRGIRAEKLTDLIYNPGYEDGERPPGSREAAVTVVLDNTDGALSRSQVVNAAGTEDVGDCEAITIKRRVKETEENYYSYYYLNGRSVNLSDIQDLLSQAGVTPEGYNVVMQGDVTEIINMTPYQRRQILDEIAGVAEFDAKKADAFDELEVVKERIDEAELRIDEKQQRLDQLEDEREKALEFRDLREEKERYESYVKAAELEDKRAELAETEADIEDQHAVVEDRKDELDTRQGRVKRLEEDLEDLNAEIERKGEDEQLRIKREIEEVKGEIDRLENAIETAEEAIEDAEAERKQAFVQIDHKQETIEDLEAQIRETKLEKANVTAEIEDREARVEELNARIDDVDTEYDEVKTELQEAKAAIEELKNEKNELQREQDRLLDEARRRSNEESEKEAEIEAAEAEIPELEAERSDLEHELEKATANQEQIDGVVADLREEKSSLQDELDELEHKLEAKRNEYAELEAKADREGDSSFPRSVTTVLKSDLEGVHGAVAQLGSVEGQYATACETAAGGRMANVVVDDDGVGQRAIDYLKSRNAGRATFLPISEMYTRSLPDLPDHPGVVDFAYNLVDVESAYAGVFSYVLGDTVVVEDLDVARELMGDWRLVTLDGDLVEKSGAMTGGSSSGSRWSFSQTGKGRLERLAEEIHDLQDERDALKSSVRDIEDRLEDARDRQTEAADQVRSIEGKIERKDAEIDRQRDRIETLEDELAEIEAERESVDEEMQELEAAIAEQEAAIEEKGARVEELESELADSEIPELTAQLDGVHEEIAERRGRLDDLDARLNEFELEKRYAEESVENLHDEVEAAQNRKAAKQERIEELEGTIADHEDTLAEKRAEVEAIEAELADLKADREELRESLREAQTARDEKRDALSRAQSELERLEASARELREEIETLEAEVEEYDPDEVPDLDEVEREIDELQREMDALEPVNMLAIDEYDEVAGDLEVLTERRDTLDEERAAIRERIESYEAQKKATFMDAFESIDTHFQDIFERLSAGSGELHLEDYEDPFEGGLTMKAEPGDKPVQRLEAMSGGEKSLTALAFIFAIQRHDPAPFYALDEIDAFLDAANAERVGEMVDELASDAQFIVVSHRSAMLERSERAIGVTMQDDNVSAVTGIDLAGQREAVADD